jgi:catechol O-methyltransferase
MSVVILAITHREIVMLTLRILPLAVYDRIRGTNSAQLCMEYVLATARKDDANSVLETVDHFTETRRWMMNIGREKRIQILDKIVADTKPKSVLELGTYFGYSAISIARLLEPGSRVYTVEFNAGNVEIAKKIIAHSGLSDKIEVITASSDEVIPHIESMLGTVGGIDLVVLDHWKKYYLRDLKALIEHGGLHPGSVVVADNIILPGVPDYAEFIRNNLDFRSKLYEVDDPSRPHDGMEVSTYHPRT